MSLIVGISVNNIIPCAKVVYILIIVDIIVYRHIFLVGILYDDIFSDHQGFVRDIALIKSNIGGL